MTITGESGGISSPAKSLGAAGRALLAALIACLPVLLFAAPGSAEAPGRLRSPITDTAGAFGEQTAAVQAALDALAAAENLQLWVAYVESFAGIAGPEWAAQTAAQSSLGGNDLLFAVATGDREYGFSVADSGPSDAELQNIISTYVEPELAAGQWAASAVALADGLRRAGAGAGGEGSSGGSLFVPVLLGGAAVAGAGGYLFYRSRKQPGGSAGGAGAAAPEVVSEAELRKQAAAALIEADDSLKTSEQELGFAIAQFGEQAAAPFSAALEESRADLRAAFARQQQLDDAEQDTPAERGAWLAEIIDRARAADQRLDEQVDAFDELRAMDRDIGKILPELAGRARSLAAAMPKAQASLEQLSGQYPAAAVKLPTDNLTEAGHRIKFAADALAKGEDLLGAGERSGAVANARAAEEALGQAQVLLDTVQRVPAELASAQAAISALMAETDNDLREARKLPVAAEFRATVEHAEKTLAWAQQVIQAGNYDPITTRRALEEADNALETVLVPARGAAAERARAQALLKGTAEACVASIQAAQDFITTRRGGVGAQARTRLAEAERRYNAAVALADSDPSRALAEIQAADRLADQALEIARRDEQEYRAQQDRNSGGGLGGLGNIVLGGILIDAMSGGGRRAGGRGGGFNFPTGGGGFPGPGSFGGGGTRGRRSGGGRF